MCMQFDILFSPQSGTHCWKNTSKWAWNFLILSSEKLVFCLRRVKAGRMLLIQETCKLFLMLSVVLISVILMLCCKRFLDVLFSLFRSLTFLGDWFCWIGKRYWLGLNPLPSVCLLIKFSTSDAHWSKLPGLAPTMLVHGILSTQFECPSIKIIVKIFKAILISPWKCATFCY